MEYTFTLKYQLAAADREGIYNILTVDRKDFDRYRSPAGKRLKRLWVRD